MRLVIGATLLVLFAFVPNLGSTMGWIHVTIDNLSSYDHTYEVRDAVADTVQKIFLAGKDQKMITIKSNGQVDDGYGEIKYRKEGETSWSVRSLLRDGDGPVHM